MRAFGLDRQCRWRHADSRTMDDKFLRVSVFIREHSPHVFCSACIGRNLQMTEHDVREQLQVLVARPALQQHFTLTRRVCFGCGVLGDHVTLKR